MGKAKKKVEQILKEKKEKTVQIPETAPKVPFYKKRITLILIISILCLIVALTGVTYYFYKNPIFNFKSKTSNNKVEFNKVPFFNSVIKVTYQDPLKKESKESSKKLDIWTSGKSDIDFSKDGFYKIEMTVSGKSKTEEFELDRTAPTITADIPTITNQEKPKYKIEVDEIDSEAKLRLVSKKTVLDEKGQSTDKKEDVYTDIKKGDVEFLLLEGENFFSILAEDEFNNKSQKEFTILADFTKPKIELIQPTYDETYDGSAEAKFKVTDLNGISKVLVGETEIKGDENGVYSFKVDYKAGDNTIRINAFDKAGNEAVGEKVVLKRVTSQQRISVGGGNGGYTPPSTGGSGSQPPAPSCSNGLSGYNVFCWNNSIRADHSLGALSWNAGNASAAYSYAYCLEVKNFPITSNPHYPSQEVIDCLNERGYNTSNKSIYGTEVIAANQSTAQGYANAWANSSAHAMYTLNGSAKTFGVGIYGKWAVGYVTF